LVQLILNYQFCNFQSINNYSIIKKTIKTPESLFPTCLPWRSVAKKGSEIQLLCLL